MLTGGVAGAFGAPPHPVFAALQPLSSRGREPALGLNGGRGPLRQRWEGEGARALPCFTPIEPAGLTMP